MQYVWQYRLWPNKATATVNGDPIEIMDPGLINHNAGPDFFNAKIRIGDKLWAGNIEIHVKASDWYRHHHDSDPAYDSVILHIVAINDTSIKRSDGNTIPQTVMECAPDFAKKYADLVDKNPDRLKCADNIKDFLPIHISDWLTALAFERLQYKADRVTALAKKFHGDWGAAIYVTLARALGFSTNTQPFEQLALSTPLRMLMKHADSQTTIEGILFGQAGFLSNIPPQISSDPYVARMIKEYSFMAEKFNLAPPQNITWKMARMRPQNFPLRRLAILSAMISQGFKIGYQLLYVNTIDDARNLFDINLYGYWSRRYNFGQEQSASPKAFSQNTVSSLIINVVAPVLYAYGTEYLDDRKRESAIDFLQKLPPENNTLVRIFTQEGIQCPDAFASQALIELKTKYCDQKKCLFCRLGHRILAKRAIP